VIGVGCSKVELHDQVKVHEAEFDPAGLITGFSQKMDDYKKGVFLKSSESILIDSAIWYIDATLNYYYAMANYPCARFHWDTVFVEMNVLDSYEAMYAEVFEAYDSTLYGISDKYYEIEEDEKQFLMAMVEDMGPLPGNKRSLRIISVTGTGTLEHSGNFEPWEAYRWHRNDSIDCEFAPAVTNAPILFEALLKNHFDPPPTNPNCRWVYYGDPEVITYWYYDYPSGIFYPPTPPNYLDYKVFFASSAVGPITAETKCLEHNQHGLGLHEMQYYYDNLKDFVVAYHNSLQNTGNRRFAVAFIESDDDPGSTHIIQHIPQITYKKRMLECSASIIIPER
jgi:hypothetical protein